MYNGVARKANMALYGDVSQRVVAVLKSYTPAVEIYSIDESFLYLPQVSCSYHKWGIEVKQAIFKQVGIPVGIGFGRSKTLAKVANALAKRRDDHVLNIHDYNEDYVLKTVAVNSLWGVGKGLSSRLRQEGIHYAYGLKYAPIEQVRARCHVHGVRMKLELQGMAAYPLQTQAEARKSITRSRTFVRPLDEFSAIQDALWQHVDTVGKKLRKEGLKAYCITVVLFKNRFKYTHYYQEQSIDLPIETASTPYLRQAATTLLKQLYQAGNPYIKTGVLCHVRGPSQQLSLFQDELQEYDKKWDRVMAVCDQINARWKKQVIK